MWREKRWQLAVSLYLVVGVTGRADAAPACLACHGAKAAGSSAAGAPRIDDAIFAKSIHASLDCEDCHSSITTIPHPARLPLVDCGSCHTDSAASYQQHGGHREQVGHELPACWDCHGEHDIFPASDARSKVAATNLPKTCGHCHANPAIVGKYHIPMLRPVQVFAASVHARTPHGADRPAATCIDCHSATGTGHKILAPGDPRSTVFHFNIPHTCGKCHAKVAGDYARSSHGMVAGRGETDAPVCTDCHGEHDILPISDPRSPVHATNVSLQVCGSCHGSQQVNEKYGMPTTIMASWQHSFHGLKSSDGDPDVANCASCHGAHLVLPASNPASSVNPANLKRTCGRCHRGIAAHVVKVPIHTTTGVALNRTGQVLRVIYVVAIIVIIGLMLLHWLIDLHRQIRILNHRQQVPRMRRDELWQHTLLMLSFTVLAITGFAFHYAGSWWARTLFGWEGGFLVRRWIHRVAAIVFMGTTLWHVVYLFGARGRQFARDIFPRVRDFRQFGQTIAFNLGVRRKPPRFGRFSYVEKAEYWALVWGTVVMTLTGLGLWFGDLAERWLGVRSLGVMLVVHYYEAILAGLAILIWHLYSTIFHPSVYPNNPSWYTGTMPLDMYRREHPDDLILQSFAEKQRDERDTEPPESGANPT